MSAPAAELHEEAIELPLQALAGTATVVILAGPLPVLIVMVAEAHAVMLQVPSTLT